MNKIWLIVQREYSVRVRKKSFIVMSILGPVLFGLMIAAPIAIAALSGGDKVIQIVDQSGLFANKFKDTDKIKFDYIGNQPVEQAKANLVKDKHDGLLLIPPIDLDKPQGIELYSESSVSPMVQSSLERTIKKEVEDLKLLRSGIDKRVLDSVRTSIDIKTITLEEGGEKVSSSEAATGVGYVAAFGIYLFIFLYGAQIMRGVIEEKTNRIIEVIISSVKPFQLMMGKILGVGGVALTQFLIWVVLSMAISTLATSLLGLDQAGAAQAQELAQAANNPDLQRATAAQNVFDALGTVNIPLVLGCFLFYFLGGYLMYGALFGAVGAAVDNETDTQQFMLPLTLPLLVSIISLSAVIADPNGSLAFWLSLFPLTSPVVMMIRVPFIGATWELYLSMALLVLGFLGAVWLAGRIYRVGILMYGKKPTYRELSKWLFYKM